MATTRALTIPTLLLLGCGLLAARAPAQQGTSSMGHSRTRALAERGRLPEPGDVVIEDIVNYHRHPLPRPRSGEWVALDVRFGSDRSARGGRAVLQIGLATPELHERRDLPPLNLALVIDKSSSMESDDKIGRVRQGLLRFVDALRPTDRVALVVYSTTAEVLLESGPVREGDSLRRVIRSLEPDGRTNLHAGLMLGYEQVMRNFVPDGANRVILLTDGIANTGVTDVAEILRDSRGYNGEGVDLSTIGVGLDFQRELLRELSEGGRGLFHFVSDAADIEKVFVDEVQSLMAPVARKVSLEINVPPELKLRRVFGYSPERDGRHISLALDDLNFGVTQVVMMEFAVRGSSALDPDVEVEARLSFADEETGQREVRTGRAALNLRTRRPGDFLADPEVRKNYVIARLAQSLRDMAELSDKGQLGKADRALAEAQELTRERFPSAEDPDVRRTLDMVKRYRKVLDSRIEGFRDLLP